MHDAILETDCRRRPAELRQADERRRPCTSNPFVNYASPPTFCPSALDADSEHAVQTTGDGQGDVLRSSVVVVVAAHRLAKTSRPDVVHVHKNRMHARSSSPTAGTEHVPTLIGATELHENSAVRFKKF
ncbi:hypothetical protein GUJ93_ZPchr0010g9178 [Zizania palustris]|uniref:Uncharacterized protein n=1 Tax=Zizania palustris TaxID=103762 RepID=A0A8J5WBK1_ZIZPA|nr:hypothetical protein GUJ93_ZPchr0010g9178 [Zizania palustris]